LYPNKEVDIESQAKSIAMYFSDPVYSHSANGDSQFFYTTSFKGSGFGDIFIPLLLGGLIIFSSLLGSIVDREREIFTFSALGLAPPNVAALFFAESAVYAVIGGVGGYLISQSVAALLNYLGQIGFYQAPEMNFSSLSSIYTILMVMGIVLLSTIYPAIKAGKSANPGIARKWKMPDPIADTLDFIFPFTISENNLLGIVSFIAEHFNMHQDASLGLFACKDVQVLNLGLGNYGIKANCALSPFDLGIAQAFTLRSQDSDIPGIKEIHITLKRTGGTEGPWLRSNRLFLDDLRLQFLLWRSLPVETISYYCQQTKEQSIDSQLTSPV
ncbi:MAG: FtsX-like permease family protein, partial [Planctomycetes bacterium]|nr:FtsX-like permease family protein [Planctomycetota bacterium]